MANALQVKYANTASQYQKEHPFSTEPKANEFVSQDAQNPIPMMPVSVIREFNHRCIHCPFILSILLT